MMNGFNRCAWALGFLTLGACGAHGEPVEDDVAVDPVDTAEQEIVGGFDANFGDLPWMVRIRRNGAQHCGGVLLHPNWVLTAGHCLERDRGYPDEERYHPAEYLELIAGDHRVSITETTEQRRKFTQDDVKVHEQWARSADMPYNDVALIRVNTPFTINKAVGTIALASSTPQRQVTVAGWGRTFNGFPIVLQQASVPILPTSTCGPPALDRVLFSAIETCAGTSEVGICRGDSGGPLFDVVNGRATLFGTSSWGLSNCDHHQVYTRIPSLAPWIRDKIKQPLTRNIVLRTSPTQVHGTIRLYCTSTGESQSGSMSVQGVELSLDCPNGQVQVSVDHSEPDRPLTSFYRIVNGTRTNLPYSTTWAQDFYRAPAATRVTYYYTI